MFWCYTSWQIFAQIQHIGFAATRAWFRIRQVSREIRTHQGWLDPCGAVARHSQDWVKQMRSFTTNYCLMVRELRSQGNDPYSSIFPILMGS